jgi:mannan endo-1,4-beta-mannosidase
VISEAKNYGIRLILSLVNNFDDFGGRAQYVMWAHEAGEMLNSKDDFYTSELVKKYYKNHIKVITVDFSSFHCYRAYIYIVIEYEFTSLY